MTREEIENNRQYQLTDAAIEYCRKEHPHYDGEALGEIIDACLDSPSRADIVAQVAVMMADAMIKRLRKDETEHSD